MKLTENDVRYIINEIQNRVLLTEDQESDSIRKAIRLYMERMGCDKDTADRFVRVDLRQDIPNLRSKKGGKFILGVTRMFLDRQLTNAESILNLNTTIAYVASDAHYNEYDKNLNGLSAQDIIKRFSDAVKKDAEADRENLSKQQYQRNDNYQIIPISSFEEAKKYSPYTSWCVTHYKYMLNSYTNDGIGQFYFCLKKGFENIPEEVGPGCPLDEYGLSMIAVCVDGNGRLKTCTCRWNHDNGGSDNIMGTKQISELIGANFYDVFKPNNKWQETVNEIKAKLADGMPLGAIFNSVDKFGDSGLYKVQYGSQYNLVNEEARKLISDTWFDYIGLYKSHGFIQCKISENYVVLNLENGLVYSTDEAFKILLSTIKEYLEKGEIPEEYFERKTTTYEGDIRFKIFGQWGLITKDKEIKFNRLFDQIERTWNSKYFRVMEDEAWYLLDENGNDVLGRGYKYVGVILDEMGGSTNITIRDNDGYNVVSLKTKKKLSPISFDGNCSIYDFNENDGYIFLGKDKDGGTNLYTSKGEKICKQMDFDNIATKMNDIYTVVTVNNKENLMSFDGKILSDIWFSHVNRKFSVDKERSPYIFVTKDNKESLFSLKTNSLAMEWFEKVSEPNYGSNVTDITEKGKKAIYKIGEGIISEWFDNVERGYLDDFYIVTLKGKQNIFNTETKNYTLDEWYDELIMKRLDLFVEKDGELQEIPFTQWRYGKTY